MLTMGDSEMSYKICKWFLGYMLMLTGVIILLLVLGCAAIGLYQMSDDWCRLHPEAGASRCAGRDK
jgi:hypothetical protein